jgi:hypothetical protein
MVTKALRRNLLATTIIAGTLMSTPVFAQGTTPAADAPKDEDTIVVTGSLISNPNLTSSSPVSAVSSDELSLKQTVVAEPVSFPAADSRSTTVSRRRAQRSTFVASVRTATSF